ncbi:hypothetical protein NPIL_86761 [Nephila pilipes]|uniref:Uncharacterized protein n=1 Tax=Nephila pilipes TaxID=299642 RepID=A0A8X6KER0_NEPPI|nr:hypothetical protein NPIL_86761 [Nephila pilipes]
MRFSHVTSSDKCDLISFFRMLQPRVFYPLHFRFRALLDYISRWPGREAREWRTFSSPSNSVLIPKMRRSQVRGFYCDLELIESIYFSSLIPLAAYLSITMCV